MPDGDDPLPPLPPLLGGAAALQRLTLALVAVAGVNPDLIRGEEAPYREAAALVEDSTIGKECGFTPLRDRLDAYGAARQRPLGHDQTNTTRGQWIVVIEDVGNLRSIDLGNNPVALARQRQPIAAVQLNDKGVLSED